MKKLLLIVAFAGLCTACKQEEKTAMTTSAASGEAVSEATAIAQEGHGKVNLKCGSQTLTVDGKCGGLTNTGDMIIAVQDQKIPSKIFTISFNTSAYPKDGKTYTV